MSVCNIWCIDIDLGDKERENTHTHPCNSPFSGTTRVSRYQKGKTNLDFAEARDSEWQWHELGHMQVCISLQTDNRASTSPLKVFYRPDALPAAQPTASKHWRQQRKRKNNSKTGQLGGLDNQSVVGQSYSQCNSICTQGSWGDEEQHGNMLWLWRVLPLPRQVEHHPSPVLWSSSLWREDQGTQCTVWQLSFTFLL